jgi:hypothetical protein
MNKLSISIILGFLILVSPVSHAQQSLSSNYFRNDTTAQNILSGRSFSIKDAINQDGTISINSFATKFLNGLRQVGYTGISSLVPATESSALVWLHKFQRINNLPQGDSVGPAELLKLDSLVAAREKADSQLAALLPLPLSNIVSGASTEPSSTHVAALLTIALRSLPPHLVKWNSQNILSFIQTQGPGGDAGGIQFTARGICFLNYFPSLDSQCNATNATMVPSLLKDDPSLVYDILHEYAHYLDGRIYSSEGADSSKGIIDTQGFTEISFDTSVNCNPSSPWRFFKLRNPGNERNEFVTNYAVGWTATGDESCRSSVEDFAESFAMYVMQGNTFRKLAETKPVLAQKYAWLKSNVFAGKEYFTGNADNIPAVNQALAAPYMPQLPTFIDYLNINPNFVWDYQLIGGGVASAPAYQPPSVKPPPSTITPSPNSSACIVLKRNLFYGSRGSDVRRLQVFLRAKGYLSSSPTGYFGKLTVRAVKLFQGDNNISKEVGFVGPTTRAKIKALTCGQ